MEHIFWQEKKSKSFPTKVKVQHKLLRLILVTENHDEKDVRFL